MARRARRPCCPCGRGACAARAAGLLAPALAALSGAGAALAALSSSGAVAPNPAAAAAAASAAVASPGAAAAASEGPPAPRPQPLADAPRAPRAGPSRPEFVHIPRTGGSMLEDLVQPVEQWGRHCPGLSPKRRRNNFIIDNHICSPYHIPPSAQDNVYRGKETFCIFRDVHARLLSQFYSTFSQKSTYQCTAAEFDRFVLDHFASQRRTFMVGFPYGTDCHFLPQASYVFGWDNKQRRVDHTRRWCTCVMRYDHLEEDLNPFLEARDYSARVRFRPSTRPSFCREPLGRDNLSAAARELVEQAYKDDLSLQSALAGATSTPSWLRSFSRCPAGVSAPANG